MFEPESDLDWEEAPLRRTQQVSQCTTMAKTLTMAFYSSILFVLTPLLQVHSIQVLGLVVLWLPRVRVRVVLPSGAVDKKRVPRHQGCVNWVQTSPLTEAGFVVNS